MNTTRPVIHECLAEVIGTFILVFFGVGAVHAAVLTGAQSGIWQIAVVWGAAVSLALYAVGAVSGAHINPAITVAFAAYRGFPSRKVPLYILSQLTGAILASLILYGLFHSILTHFETAAGIVRGQPGSELSAMIYGEYFPNPAIAKNLNWQSGCVNLWQAVAAEAIGTAFLAFFVFAVTDMRNSGRPGGQMFPVFVGLAVAMIISIVAPLTQAGLNPARDFGPRLFSYFAGWGSIAIPGPRGGFFAVYILAPVVGALAGAGMYRSLIQSALSGSGLSKEQIQNGCGCDSNCRCHQAPALIPNRLELDGEEKKNTTRLILVGGFLGAGKTTLLWEAASRLIKQGKRVGLITNDQASGLVDTELLRSCGLSVQEVAGSCFCCNFNGLIDAAQKLSDVDVLIAEPVGSCTDLSATILQPIKDKFALQFILSPLSVLVDPMRLKELLGGGKTTLHSSAAYILRKQLEEADCILLNKIDLLSNEDLGELRTLMTLHFPTTKIFPVSAAKSIGVDEWLAAVMGGRQAGQKITGVDYDTYARGEAVLGWLNGIIELVAEKEEVNWIEFGRKLADSFQKEIQRKKMSIGHIKFLVSSGTEHYIVNLTHTDGTVSLRGQMKINPRQVRLIINARVETSPHELEKIIREQISITAGKSVAANFTQIKSLQPGRPKPTYRYSEIA
jgi:MIP family channel proteins